MPTTTHLPDESLAKTRRSEILDHTTGLYRHTKKPEWGVAILASDEGDRRAYQFDDGKLRVFKKGYFSLMEPVERDAAQMVRKDLEEAIQVNERHARRAPLEPVMPFEDQVQGFLQAYPDGFRDLSWISDIRGSGEASRKKKFRDPAILDAQTRLAESVLSEALEAGDAAKIVAEVSDILASTDLVAVSQARAIGKVDAEHHEKLASSLMDVLHGDGKYGQRFRKWVSALTAALGKKPSWRLATCLPALMHPEEHVCVRPSTFKRQAAVFAPTRVYSKRPRRRAYSNYRHVAEQARERLEKAGLQPRDMIDVHDFIWTTLRPAALPS